MIAYDLNRLDALRMRETALEWRQKGLLSEEKWQALEKHYQPGFYTPNVFVRIGLGIFTYILAMASMGMGWMVADAPSDEGTAILCFLLGILTFFMLERWAIRQANHFGSGVDDMLLYIGVGFFLASIYLLLPYNSDLFLYLLIALPFLLLGSLRYLDRLMAIGAFLCLCWMLLLVVKDLPRIAVFVLPFSAMLFSAGIYLAVRKGQSRHEWRYWHKIMTTLECVTLIVFYASGNYWVVQQTGAEWLQLEQVPMAGFFWLFTFMVPALYIFEGIRRKDRLLLDIGLACVAVAVFSFRFYYHVISLAWAATIAGAVLFATAYFSIRYLRHHSGAYTYDSDGDATMLQEIEEQLIEQTISAQNPPAPPAKPESFGGGQFGGGGGGGDF